ncbi:MAG: V-type ATP synthase subunit I [Candidatus Heimdallarchaeota archaeon]
MSLLPERMKTVKVVVPHEYARNLYRYISSSDNFDIIDVQKKPLDMSSFDHGAEVSELSEKFDKVVKSFEIADQLDKIKAKEINDLEFGTVFKEIKQISTDVITKLNQIDDRITLAEQELKKNKSTIEVAENLIPFGFSFEDLDDERPYFAIVVGRMNTKRLPRFKWNLDAITDSNYVLKESPSEGTSSFIAIGFLERYQEDINRLLVAYGFEKYSVPERISGNPEKVVEKSKKKIDDLIVRIEELEKEAQEIIKKFGPEILAYSEQLHVELNYFKISNMMRHSKRNVAFWAWVPQKATKKVGNDINKITEKNAIVEFTKPVFEESEFPTKTSVPKFARIYDGLVSAYGVPGYKEFNTAILIQIFFPIMFGIMFGDVIHGALFMLTGFWGLSMRNKVLGTSSFMDEIKGYFKGGAMLIIVSGAVAMVFGVLFGSYGGMNHHVNPAIPEPLWFSPESHDPQAFNPGASTVILMLELSLLIGMIHMTIGYVLRLVKEIREKHFKEALLVTIPWIIFHWALFILVFTFGTNFMTWFDPTNVGYFDIAILSFGGAPIPFPIPINALWFFVGAMVVPILIMSIYLATHGLEGFAEIIEILLSTLSNTVSYARIFAMNAVHGALSRIFLFLDADGHMTGFSYAGIVIGSLVILVLEGLFSFIQTLRLQWVEFFAKVGYQGTGFKFQSMAFERKYSQAVYAK